MLDEINRSGHVVWFGCMSWGDYLQLLKMSDLFSMGFVLRTSTGKSGSLEALSRDKGPFCSFWKVHDDDGLPLSLCSQN